jgi:hypothetical protein
LLFGPIGGYEEDVLRPVDFSGLPNDHKYAQDLGGLVVQGSPSRLITWRTAFIRDGTVLIVVPTGQLPITGDETAITHTMSLKPTGHLEIDRRSRLCRLQQQPGERNPSLCLPAVGQTVGCDSNPPNGVGLIRGNRLINDGRVFFVKVSYLFRR